MTWTLILYTLTTAAEPRLELQRYVPGFESRSACIVARDELMQDYVADGEKVDKLYPHVVREWPRLGGVCVAMGPFVLPKP